MPKNKNKWDDINPERFQQWLDFWRDKNANQMANTVSQILKERNDEKNSPN